MTLGIGERINGVNLGNWLVLEKWMKPDLFAACGEEDEIWMHRTMDSAALWELLARHRDTYVTLEDFREIARRGYNLVRIPVPYFVLGDRDGHPGCVEYLDKAFDWAEQTGLKVMIDMHTVPGSQNGYDNGGLTGVCKWCRNPAEVEYVLTVLERLAARYRDRPALHSIEVVNEPISWLVYRTAPSTGQAKDKEEARGSGPVPMRFLKTFYREAYSRLRLILRPETVIVFHDGFRLGAWGGWFRREGMRNVILDTHIYITAMEGFMPIHAMWVYRAYVGWNKWQIRRASRHIPVIVGEWCLVNQLALDAGKAAPSTESGDEARARVYREVAALELDAWNVSGGQIYWNYQLRRDGEHPTDFRTGGDLEAWDLTRAWAGDWIS